MLELKRYLAIFLLISVMLISVSAFSPIQKNSDVINGLDINPTIITTHKVGEDATFNIQVYNSSNGLIVADNDNVSCLINIYSPIDGSILYENTMSVAENIVDYEQDVNGSVFPDVGEYPIVFYCQHLFYAGGYASYSFDVTLDGKPDNMQNIISSILLIIIIVGLMVVIKNKHSNTDFSGKRKERLSSDKSYAKKFSGEIVASLFKNLFFWMYIFGWFIIFILKDVIYRFTSQTFYNYFELFANIYSLGFLLVVGFMIGYTIDYIIKSIEILSDKDWGVGDA